MRCLLVALLLVSVFPVAGCTKPATQLVVTVDSDLAPQYLVAVHAVAVPADSPTSPGVDARFDLTDTGGPVSFTLPLSFGVVPPGGDASRRVEVRMEALDATGTATVVRLTRTGFVSGQTLRLPMFLADACRSVVCSGDLVCDRGVCVSPDVPVDDLARVRPGDELLDAGSTPIVDAGARDGGPPGPAATALTADWVLQGLEVPAATDPLTRVTSMCATPTGVVVAGYTTKAANFGASLPSSMPVSTGATAIWVARVDAGGTITWLRSLEGGALINSIDLVDDLLVITGRFQGAFSFAPGSLNAVDSVDGFAAGLELSNGQTRWATSLGTQGGDDFGAGAAGTDLGVVVGAWSPGTVVNPFHVGGTTPAALEGEPMGQALIAVLDPTNGALIRAVGLRATILEWLALSSDGDHGAILGLASRDRVTGLHPAVAGGSGHQIALARLDASAGWAWTTYLEGCTSTTSLRVTRNAGAVWTAFTDSGCGMLPVTLATPGSSRAGTPIDPGTAGQVLMTLGLDARDGTPLAASLRAVALDASGGSVGALTADGADALYVGGFIGLPAGGAMLDFGGGPTTFTRNMSGAVQSNGAAFLWSHGIDGTFRGVDSWTNGGAGTVTQFSDMVSGIAVDSTGVFIAGWLHGLGFITTERIGGGTGFDVAFLVHAH